MGVMATPKPIFGWETIHGGLRYREAKQKVEVDNADIRTFLYRRWKKWLVERPPVVTIIGHVDHGKTTLSQLPFVTQRLRQTGGITQHGATKLWKMKIATLIHRPHLCVRVVHLLPILLSRCAADDGVYLRLSKPLTHSKRLRSNHRSHQQIDKPVPERVISELAETWCYINCLGRFVEISAKFNKIILLGNSPSWLKSKLKSRPTVRAISTVIKKHAWIKGKVQSQPSCSTKVPWMFKTQSLSEAFGRVHAMTNDLGRHWVQGYQHQCQSWVWTKRQWQVTTLPFTRMKNLRVQQSEETCQTCPHETTIKLPNVSIQKPLWYP